MFVYNNYYLQIMNKVGFEFEFRYYLKKIIIGEMQDLWGIVKKTYIYSF